MYKIHIKIRGPSTVQNPNKNDLLCIREKINSSSCFSFQKILVFLWLDLSTTEYFASNTNKSEKIPFSTEEMRCIPI